MTEQVLNDRYALDEKVGEGGMAVTYRARDLLLNRTVAVKLMREQFTSDPTFVERFRREAQSAARLNHEHIAGVYDTGRASGTHYIVMEFVEGTDLKYRLLHAGAMPVLESLDIARQIAAALDVAHRAGLVHRDIKPHNILLTRDRKVKVTDFGIAKMVSEGEDTGVIIGSVHYLSPEQARGETTTPGSDLYSLGAVLYEMLTGQTVFKGETALAVAHKQIYERPPAPRAIRPGIPPAVEAVVLKCLEKDPARRYQSAAELRTVLTQLCNQLALEDTIVVAAPPPLDATQVYRKPVATAPAPAPAPTATVTAPMPPRPVRVPRIEPEPPRGNGTWVILILFLVLAGAVGYGGWRLMQNPGAAPSPPREQPVNPRVPSLVGRGAAEAELVLRQMKLRGQVYHEASDTVDEGKVIRQQPSPDARAGADTVVSYWVSDGAKIFVVPNVAEMSLDAAKQQIRAAGFKGEFGEVKKEESPLPEGQVIRTEPAAGSVNDRNIKVTLVVSKAPTGVREVYKGAAPNLGAERTQVRIEIEQPAGSKPRVIYEGTLRAGSPIPDQPFERKASERVIMRLYAAPDGVTPLEVQGEEAFPPLGEELPGEVKPDEHATPTTTTAH